MASDYFLARRHCGLAHLQLGLDPLCQAVRQTSERPYSYEIYACARRHLLSSTLQYTHTCSFQANVLVTGIFTRLAGGDCSALHTKPNQKKCTHRYELYEYSGMHGHLHPCACACFNLLYAQTDAASCCKHCPFHSIVSCKCLDFFLTDSSTRQLSWFVNKSHFDFVC
jgi:hypothetical protein